jgi:hypothetical protein
VTDQRPFHPAEIVEVLGRHGVEYVAIGAFAALAQGAPIPATADIDVTPRTTAKNLVRLSAALDELDARIRTEAIPEGLPFSPTARASDKRRPGTLTSGRLAP